MKKIWFIKENIVYKWFFCLFMIFKLKYNVILLIIDNNMYLRWFNEILDFSLTCKNVFLQWKMNI